MLEARGHSGHVETRASGPNAEIRRDLVPVDAQDRAYDGRIGAHELRVVDSESEVVRAVDADDDRHDPRPERGPAHHGLAELRAVPPAASTLDLPMYQRLAQRLMLPVGGQIPNEVVLDAETRDSALDRIEIAWRRTGELEDSPLRKTFTIPTAFELDDAFKKWFASHAAFIPMLGIAGHSLNEASAAFGKGDRRSASKWTELGARIRRGLGGLFAYGVDFQPCATIYGDFIRVAMPEGFTGFEIREREFVFEPAVARFRKIFAVGTVEREEWTLANARYKELHEGCKYAAVPDGVSLSVQHLAKYGERPALTEEAFETYDRWFGIERSASVSRIHLMKQVLDVAERIVGDLRSGHRLKPDVIHDIQDGLRAVMEVFGNWVGPIDERSRHEPKHRRGE